MSNRKVANVWKFFFKDPNNEKKAICKQCNNSYSAGSTTALVKHLKSVHPTKHSEWRKMEASDEATKVKKAAKEVEDTKIKQLRSKDEREAALQLSLPDYVKSKAKWNPDDDRAQRLHRSIFEEIVLDLQPFSMVDNIGFLRTKQITVPNFVVGSSWYYRSLLDPTYEKVRSKLMAMVKDDNPVTISLSLDGWSAHRHSYMGVNIQYINAWKRKSFNLACLPFDVRHSAENIRNYVTEEAQK